MFSSFLRFVCIVSATPSRFDRLARLGRSNGVAAAKSLKIRSSVQRSIRRVGNASRRFDRTAQQMRNAAAAESVPKMSGGGPRREHHPSQARRKPRNVRPASERGRPLSGRDPRLLRGWSRKFGIATSTELSGSGTFSISPFRNSTFSMPALRWFSRRGHLWVEILSTKTLRLILCAWWPSTGRKTMYWWIR